MPTFKVPKVKKVELHADVIKTEHLPNKDAKNGKHYYLNFSKICQPKL